MKNLLFILMLAVAFVFTSCSDDDDPTAPETTTDPIVGTWLSEGANIPIGLRVTPFRVVKIVATFNENKTYTVVQTDSSNVETTLTGTYINSESGSTDNLAGSATNGSKIWNIVATQSAPYAVTSTGIYAVKGSDMTYEIVQTTPAIPGVDAPTPEGGFGSTKIGGTPLAIYVQKYVKQ
jgi:hypothetical protein